MASGPGAALSRFEVSRTHVQGLRTMRSGVNPLFAPGLSVVLSGVILGTLAVVFT